MLGLDPYAARKAWTYAAVAMLLWVVYTLRKPLIVLVLAVMFAYLLSPAVRFVRQNLRLRRNSLAVLALFLITVTSLGITGSLLRKPVRVQLASLRDQAKAGTFRERLDDWRILGLPVGKQLSKGDRLGRMQAHFMDAMPTVGDEVISVTGLLAMAVLVPIISFILLVDGQHISDAVMSLLFHNEDGEPISDRQIIVMGVITSAHILISEYMRALVALCFSVLVSYGIVLAILRVPYAILLALFAFPLEFIPVVGPIAAGLVIVGACEFYHYPHVAVVILFLLLYRMLQDYVISPQLMKRTVQLHPLAVIFGVFAGGEIGGVVGIFLSIPLLAIGRLVFYEYRKYNDNLRRATPALTTPGTPAA